MIWALFLASFLYFGFTGSADAAGVATLLGTLFAGKVTVGTVILKWLAKTALSVGLSALAQSLKSKRSSAPAGIATNVTTSGGVTSQKLIFGVYATAGQWLAPPDSYGVVAQTPRAYLVYSIAVCAAPGVTLSRIAIDGEYVALDVAGATWGQPALGRLAGYAHVAFQDGSQTAANADMLTAFGSAADRPWLADMIGRGVAIVTARFLINRALYNGLPSVLCEMVGLPLYDPRLDSTVGGTGPQRWADSSTWTQTDNPVVIIYNILRGFALPHGKFYGGGFPAEDLPFANWIAAMNECDVLVAKDGGGTERQYRAGIEVAIAEDQPIDVIRELLKCCAGQMTEVGGYWKIRVGPVGMPVLFVGDDDLLVSRDSERIPFPPFSEVYNGITASYPEPASLWKPKNAPARLNPTWEAQDWDRRLMVEQSYRACPFGGQIQRLMAADIADHRRFLQHRLTLDCWAAVLEPLDACAWTSAEFGYSARVFEISGLTDQLLTGRQALQVRARDASDYVPAAYLPVTQVPSSTTPPAAQTVEGWDVVAEAVLDASGNAWRPGARLIWDANAALDATGIAWELRRAGAVAAQLSGIHGDVSTGSVLITAGVGPDQGYEGRGRWIVGRSTVWSAWKSITTDNLLIQGADMAIGAVSRRVGFSKVAGELLLTATDAGSAQVLSAVSLYEAMPSEGSPVNNPVRMTGALAVTRALALPTAFVVALQYRVNSVSPWVDMYLVTLTADPNHYDEEMTFNVMLTGTAGFILAGGMALSREYRFTAHLPQNVAGVLQFPVFVTGFTGTLEQINR